MPFRHFFARSPHHRACPTERRKRQEQPRTQSALTTCSSCLHAPIHANAHHSAVCPPRLHVTLSQLFPYSRYSLPLSTSRGLVPPVRIYEFTIHVLTSASSHLYNWLRPPLCDAGLFLASSLHILSLQSQTCTALVRQTKQSNSLPAYRLSFPDRSSEYRSPPSLKL